MGMVYGSKGQRSKTQGWKWVGVGCSLSLSLSLSLTVLICVVPFGVFCVATKWTAAERDGPDRL